MQLTAIYKLVALEVFSLAEAPAASGNSRSWNHDGFDRQVQLTQNTTPAVTKVAYFDQALSGGAATIDLTALPHLGDVVDGTGLNVRAFRLYNPGTNPVTISKGASNGYEIFGGADGEVTVLPGHAVQFGVALGGTAGELAEIGSGAKTIDLVGTGTDEFEVSVAMG